MSSKQEGTSSKQENNVNSNFTVAANIELSDYVDIENNVVSESKLPERIVADAKVRWFFFTVKKLNFLLTLKRKS